MTEQMRVTIGLPPWSPASDATLIETVDLYDKPTTVIVSQRARYFLGQALIGVFGPRAVWAYAPLSHDQVTTFLAAAGAEQVDALIDEGLVDRVLGVLAVDDEIVFAHEVELGRPVDRTAISDLVVQGVTEALEELLSGTRLAADPADTSRPGS